MTTKKSIKVGLEKSKETKGTWQYREVNGGTHIRTLYLSKENVKKLGNPTTILVTVETRD